MISRKQFTEENKRIRAYRKMGKTDQWIKGWLRGWRMVR